MLLSLALAVLVACAPSDAPPASSGPSSDGQEPAQDSGEAGTSWPAPDPTVTEEALPGYDDPIYAEDGVLQIEITLSESAMNSLRSSPFEYVEGDLSYGGHTWQGVGVRLKGSASFRMLDDKPDWKIKFEDYGDERFYGLDRLTLQNDIWDTSMMAQNLAYRFFAAAGSPSPRTGYAWVTLNGTDKGLYTILESMDGQFIDRVWPGSEGNLYEMTRECDLNGDGSCYELQVSGDDDGPDALHSATAAVASGSTEALREAFDWAAVMAFFATERVINHPDSYTYNLNNYFLYHEPATDRLSFVPWGADSTFVYTYPPDKKDYPCSAASYYDVLAGSPHGWLGRFCEGDADCREDLYDAMAEVADLLISTDLAGTAEATRERIRDYVAEDPFITWDVDDFDAKIDCFETWILARPDEIHAYTGR